jgi:chemotaxis protein methyltransferase CheR
MTDRECVALLLDTLPRLGLQYPGFRRVRGIVRKRLGRRLRQLGLTDVDAYRAHLGAHPDEWAALDAMCRIPISRFFRDGEVFRRLCDDVLPDLARRAERRGDHTVSCWSAGCGSGEEPYTLAMAWRWSVPAEPARPALRIVATDAAADALARARRGCYPDGSLKELPAAWRSQAFVTRGDARCVEDTFREGVAFVLQDLRAEQPAGPFDLVLCRNMAFTYFDAPTRARVLARIVERLHPAGVLVIGHKEDLAPGDHGLDALDARLRVYRKRAGEP